MRGKRAADKWILLFFLGLFFFSYSGLDAAQEDHRLQQQRFSEVIQEFSGSLDRSSGTKGAAKAVAYIKSFFKDLGYETGSQTFSMPVRLVTKTCLTLEKTGRSMDISPFLSNAISPDTLAEPGIQVPLVYVGKGEMGDFNHQKIKDAIVLMDLDSQGNWINALALGAKALVYVFEQPPDRFLFEDKLELSPVKFPKFILSATEAEFLLPGYKTSALSNEAPLVRISSDVKWTPAAVENIYCMVPGRGDTLKDELIIVEGFYDTSGFVLKNSPGADQSCSIASLLDLATFLKNNPPERSVLLIATAGHGNSLSGMREMIWSLDTKSSRLKKMRSEVEERIAESEQSLELLDRYSLKEKMDKEELDRVQKTVQDTVKTGIDSLSNRLMRLRLEKDPDETGIKRLADQRMVLKRFESRNDLVDLTREEADLMMSLIQPAREKIENTWKDAKKHQQNLISARKFKQGIQGKNILMIFSLHLSSHGTGIGAFNEGWLYDIDDSINTFAPYVKMNETLLTSANQVACKLNAKNLLKDTLRPSLHRSWRSYFRDKPPLGGEVSNLAGYPGLSLVTTDDARQFWNTPGDTLEKVDMVYAADQSRFISNLIEKLASASDILFPRPVQNGFATLTGRANFLRHGAVFPDAPAPGSIILSFQGPGIFYAMVDDSGEFSIKGLATRNLTVHKAILEGYKFDETTGDTLWAIDKKLTTKDRYRVRMKGNRTETGLVMFPCTQTTLLDLLEPRTFRYMTRLQVLDARTDAVPVRHWYSRIDTRSSIISSIYLQPGTPMKLALSDTLLTKKFLLTHSDQRHPEGNGYPVDGTPLIAPTPYLASKDMWSLLNPRINNLEDKGINSRKIKDLQIQGNEALKEAKTYFEQKQYDRFFSSSGNALALAGRVYDHVLNIQKDVLYGVLFYIVLFAPFAFCMERMVFAFINIYKRIAGFVGILVLLIAVIYNVHPAFDLAYSPIVIILAFFIIGLSAAVTWIIFNHFENEMKRFQQHGKRRNEGEITLLKAFSASFLMGVNNLRRRRVRTVLTCTTLVILTFTIMSFTSVKSIRQHSRVLYNDKTPYQGLLVKQINWQTLPGRAFKIIENSLASHMIAAPRAWLETNDRSQAERIPLMAGKEIFEANGLVGLSPNESNISGLSAHLTRGRWFSPNDRYAVILPENMARQLNLPNPDEKESFITLWSIPFKVIGTFSGKHFDTFMDLDGEPLTPAVFPDEVFQKTTEAEVDAMESGDDIRSFQSRYKHIPFDQIAVIPYDTLISMGGSLKSIALKYKTKPLDNASTFQMVDRFGLWLFSGEKNGVYIYSASDGLNYSGLPNIFIPILISVFIVLNTMIGSVQERKKEIGIYTSIGMAPSHVSIIFIAEAVSYAVLSVVMGYLLAQLVVKVFAGTALLSGLTVNYSSLGGVFAMAMVMLVVVLSAIYPSRIAAAIAIPDVEKSWEMAKAEGNTLSIDLPFLIKEIEALSLCGFLYQLFDSHRAISHGIFSVGRLEVTPLSESLPDGKKGIGEGLPGDFQIDFTAWLAPFDLGVMQQVHFNILSSPLFQNYMEIRLAIVRQAGEHNTWWRVNKRFVNLIRKQLLIWRAMTMAEKGVFADLMTSRAGKKDTAIV